MNYGLAGRKRPNQPPEHEREITIRKSRACIYAALPYPVMGAMVSGGGLGLGLRLLSRKRTPSLNEIHAESSLPGHEDIHDE